MLVNCKVPPLVRILNRERFDIGSIAALEGRAIVDVKG